MGKLITEVARFVVFIALITATFTYESAGRVHKRHPAWAKTVGCGKERKTVMQFYFHDVISGDNVTAVQVVPAPGSKHAFFGFGFIAMVDDPLTVGPHPNSKLVGRAQGLYGSCSREDATLIMDLTYFFQDGRYNGSSLSILGRNSVLKPVREFPVIGGTGLFRMAVGYALARTYSITSRAAIVGYNITVYH